MRKINCRWYSKFSRESLKPNILSVSDDLLPCQNARSGLRKYSMSTALYHHSKAEACPYSAANNAAPGHLGALVVPRKGRDPLHPS